ncbi:MAG: hypothetical protein OEQ39_00070 [Gammaproteobacteria bacterium]|nr:hypothetical protein [Gammaproteobacteria bacterium]
MQIDYTAKRSLKAGHVVDTGYTINVNLQSENRTFESIGPRLVALDGSTVTVVHRRQNTYQLTSAFITDTSTPDNEDMVEFLDSVISGEIFQLDLTGALADYILDTTTYRRSRQGNLNIFTYSFRVRAL